MNEKITIQPKDTIVGRAASLDLLFSSLLMRAIFSLIWIVGIISVASLALQSMLVIFSVGLALIGVAIFLSYLTLRLFFLKKIKYPKITTLKETGGMIDRGEVTNLANVFSFHLAKATQNLFASKKIEEVTSKELLISLLKTKDMIFILSRLGVPVSSFEQLLAEYKGEEKIIDIMALSLKVADSLGHDQIEIGDVFISLCETDSLLKNLISNLELNLDDIKNLVNWRSQIVRESIENRGFFNPKKFHFNGGIGKDWAYGYTPFLKQFSYDLTDSIKSSGLNIGLFGKDQAVKEIKEALLHQTNGNAVIIGEPGVGKKTAVLAFANDIYEGKTESALDFFHVVEISTDSILSGSSPEQISGTITTLLNEVARAGNIIVFIDNLQNLLSDGTAGTINAKELLLPFLDQSSIKIIGAMDAGSFDQYIRSDSVLSQKFTPVKLEEPNKDDLIKIILSALPGIEYNTGCFVTYLALKAAISASDKYIMDEPNPQKTLSLLDGAAARVSSARGKSAVVKEDILEYVTEKYGVPATEATNQEKDVLLNLAEKIHEYVIGQDQAVDAIANALIRTRAGVTETKKPIGSFLFLGPTGVGKTETAKSLARVYFGGEDKMIRFDMSEYQNKEDLYRLIGSNLHGEMVAGTLATAVREHPFSLLLFDEIEKSHPDILNLFLQILDEGEMTDGNGKKASFTNTIIIATSNAGSDLIRQSLQNGSDYNATKQQLIGYLQDKNIYRPEFINRFTEVVAFSPISHEDARKIAEMMIESLKKTVLTNRQVSIEVTPEAIDLLAELGYDKEMGARPMARIIQEKIENFIAEKILKNELNKGDSITIGPEDISVKK